MFMKLLATFGLMITASLAGQQRPSPTSETLITQIQRGYRPEILEAGKTGDIGYVPHLRALLASKPDDPGVVFDTRMALAKLGEHDQLQEFLCETNSKNVRVELNAINKALPYIGGWYAVSRLRELLQNTPKNRQTLGANDEVFASLSKNAVVALEELFPDGPKRNPALNHALSQDFSDVEAWAKWIDDRQDQLQRLPPAGTYLIANCPVHPNRQQSHVVKKHRYKVCSYRRVAHPSSALFLSPSTPRGCPPLCAERIIIL